MREQRRTLKQQPASSVTSLARRLLLLLRLFITLVLLRLLRRCGRGTRFRMRVCRILRFCWGGFWLLLWSIALDWSGGMRRRLSWTRLVRCRFSWLGSFRRGLIWCRFSWLGSFRRGLIWYGFSWFGSFWGGPIRLT